MIDKLFACLWTIFFRHLSHTLHFDEKKERKNDVVIVLTDFSYRARLQKHFNRQKVCSEEWWQIYGAIYKKQIYIG